MSFDPVEEERLEVCGMDFDNLCFVPGQPDMLENGDEDNIEKPKPYRHSSSGLQAFKEDMRKSMIESQQRAAESAQPPSKKQKKKNKKSEKKNDGVADEYLMEAGQVPAASFVNTTKDRKEDNGTVVTHEEASNEMEDSRVRAMVFMISGCEDSQTSADVSNVSAFSLPDPNGRAGGACTSALLKVLYANNGKAATGLTFVQVLARMRKILKQGSYSQIPQLTSSKKMDTSQNFYLVPPNCSGAKRAVLIGINYEGQKGELSGCHNDCLNMKDYIMSAYGFEEDNIVVLMDDGKHIPPTRANILSAYQEVAAISSSGDAVFCHYSGHGGRVRDDDWGEEEDGYDETLVPVDYASTGQIRDDDIYDNLVCGMPEGSTLVSLMDCCHSGTVLDLPYTYRADGTGSGFGATANSQLAESGMRGNYLLYLVICVAIVFMVIFLPLMLTD